MTARLDGQLPSPASSNDKRSSSSSFSPPSPSPPPPTTAAANSSNADEGPALKGLKAYFYFLYALTLLLLLLPLDFLRLLLSPRSSRPRPSWTLSESVFILAVRRLMAAIDTCGFKLGVRDPRKEPAEWLLGIKGVRFEWVAAVEESVVEGSVLEDSAGVERMERVGVFSWSRGEEDEVAEEKTTVEDEDGLVGLFFHGGAYSHNSAHPRSSSSAIPKTLFNRESRFTSMHSVEYRLLPSSPFPAALQDCAAAYISLLRRGIAGRRIVLIGDSSGGHLALGLTRWVRDTLEREEREGGGKDGKEWVGKDGKKWRMEMPGGLLLLSPWTDPSHSFLEATPETYVPRRNSCDYLFEKGPFRHHIVRSLLGPSRPPSFVLSPYISPGAPSQPPSIFASFPPCFIHYGTGERCHEEGARVAQKLKEAGVRTEVVVTEDTPHDLILMSLVWRKKQVEEIWEGAMRFLGTVNVR